MSTGTSTGTTADPAAGTPDGADTAGTSPRAVVRRSGVDLGRVRVGFPGAVRSEWTKLRTLRSTWVTLALATALSVGLAALIGSTLGDASPDGGGPPASVAADPTAALLTGTAIASLVLGVLGALTVSSEYATGTVRASLTAVPRRVTVLLAKALVLTAVTAVAGGVMSAGAFWLGSSLLSNGLSASWSDPGVVPAVVGNTGYLVAVALLGAALGWLLRSTPGAITVLVALVFVVPPLLPLIPWSWVQTAADYFPAAVGQSLRTTVEQAQVLGTGTASLALVLWAVVPLVVAAVLLVRRDA